MILKENSIFNERGWLKLPNFFNKKKIEIIKKEIEKSLKGNNKFKVKFGDVHYVKDQVFTVHVLDTISKYFNKLKNEKKFLNLAENIIGDKVEPQWVQYFAKPARVGLKTPPHQDNYFWCVNGCKTLTCWLPLDKVSKKNGGLYYYNKSHLYGRLYHKASYAKGTSQTVNKTSLKKLKKNKKIFISAKPGDLIIHHGYIVHGSEKNSSKVSRGAISLWFKSKNSGYNLSDLKKYKKSLKKQHTKLQNLKY